MAPRARKAKPRLIYEYGILTLPAADDEVEFWIIRKAEGSLTWDGLAAVDDLDKAQEIVDNMTLAQKTRRAGVADIEEARRDRKKEVPGA